MARRSKRKRKNRPRTRTKITRPTPSRNVPSKPEFVTAQYLWEDTVTRLGDMIHSLNGASPLPSDKLHIVKQALDDLVTGTTAHKQAAVKLANGIGALSAVGKHSLLARLEAVELFPCPPETPVPLTDQSAQHAIVTSRRFA